MTLIQPILRLRLVVIFYTYTEFTLRPLRTKNITFHGKSTAVKDLVEYIGIAS